MDEPENVYFADLVREWAVAVARRLCWLAVEDTSSFDWVIDECWADVGLGVALRYRYRGHRLATLFDRVDIDPLGASPLPVLRREHASGSSEQQASNLYHGTFDAQGVPQASWTDDLGYGWWGPEPEDGWAAAVGRERVATVYRRE